MLSIAYARGCSCDDTTILHRLLQEVEADLQKRISVIVNDRYPAAGRSIARIAASSSGKRHEIWYTGDRWKYCLLASEDLYAAEINTVAT